MTGPMLETAGVVMAVVVVVAVMAVMVVVAGEARVAVCADTIFGGSTNAVGRREYDFNDKGQAVK